ncbi:hypothetical protein WISP_122982 [Willisornis vidua]|uniref:PDZ domain-containing protein n=1 Tax=Willisornis vidua TaxID=1566151 RepID=A0ABQ9CSV5_9PASS|nr:hypothetical protein WISP_122982 [Willisornis vidua]
MTIRPWVSEISQLIPDEMTKTVEISGEGGPLGIHVVPFFSSLSGRMLGLFIRGIEDNSRSRRDSLFHENECIVKINHVDLTDKTFAQAQDIFRQAMRFPSVVLEVLPPYNREQYEKSAIAPLFLDNEEGVPKTKPPAPVHPKPAVKPLALSGASGSEPGVQAALQQARSPSLPRPSRKPSSPSLSPLMGFGNKKHAKKIKIDLKKGPEGLGFTVVTRDSSVHGPGPIFVKNILPKGAAVKDGRLQSGDRILEVNGRDITGRTQEELVAMLRSTKQGETVCLIVARQEEAFLPRELWMETLDNSDKCHQGIPERDVTGVDGRLRVNDQLVAVNGESLLGKSNHEAMETLRRSMSMEGNIRGRIQLVVLRRLEVQAEERSDQGVFQKSAFDGSHNFAAASRRNDPLLQQFVTCSPLEGIKEFPVSDCGNGENETPPPLPPHPSEDLLNEDYNHSAIINSAVHLTDQHINFRSLTPAKQSESINLKASKSMDLVADESKVGLLAGHNSGEEEGRIYMARGWEGSKLLGEMGELENDARDGGKERLGVLLEGWECNPVVNHVCYKPSQMLLGVDCSGKDFGPTLGLKKSSSLESLQTAVAEVRKNELPFHRPRPHVVRGRGCNESFRAAIDKSYDGPEDGEEDGFSDKSSHCGQEAQNVESAPPGNPEIEDAESKAKKDKKNKEKEKKKGKSKIKEKKRKEENEDPEKKKKKGFGVMLRIYKIVLEKKFLPEKVRVQRNASCDRCERRVLTCKVKIEQEKTIEVRKWVTMKWKLRKQSRFGKKKEDKSGKADQKANPKQGMLKEEELEKMKDERESIQITTSAKLVKISSFKTFFRSAHFQGQLTQESPSLLYGKNLLPSLLTASTVFSSSSDLFVFSWLCHQVVGFVLSFSVDLEEFVTEMENSRIGAKHQELRQKQLRGLSDYSAGPGGPDIDDDEVDPNYARVNHFREAYPSANIYRASSPAAAETFVYPHDSPSTPMEREHLEGLYAKINKQHYPQISGDSGCTGGGNADRIQRLRKEYHQARREGLPFYEEDEGRAQLSDYEQRWVPGKGPDGSSYNLHFEGMERQYASLPRSLIEHVSKSHDAQADMTFACCSGVAQTRKALGLHPVPRDEEGGGDLCFVKSSWDLHSETSAHLKASRTHASVRGHKQIERGPAEPLEYLTGPRVTYKERDLPYYQGGQPVMHSSKGNHIRVPDTRVAELRYPQYYPAQPVTNQHKGPLRQDVPPSPPQPHRAPAYNEIIRHRGTSPDQYQYRQQDPRQKNPMTAAV